MCSANKDGRCTQLFLRKPRWSQHCSVLPTLLLGQGGEKLNGTFLTSFSRFDAYLA